MDKQLTFGSVCDGIGCGHLAFDRAGMACAWSAEIEAFPCAVLAERFPVVRNIGNMKKARGKVRRGFVEAPDVFIGGTPCQAFSVAGKREGLKDERGNLSLEFCRIADAIDDVRRRDGKPSCAVLWENVPGVLSDAGNAFGCFLGELTGSGCELQPPGGKWRDAGCVFGPRRAAAWRTLDSQFFGVAQRRERVFVMAGSGDFRPEEVLFEREGVRRDSPPRREKGQGITHDVAPCLTAGGRGVERAGETRGQDPVVAVMDVAPTLDCRSGKSGETTFHTSGGLVAVMASAPVVTRPYADNDGRESNLICMAHGQGGAEICEDHAPTLTCNHEAPICVTGDVAHTLRGEGFDASEDGTGRGTPLVATYDARGNGDGETVCTITGDHASRPTDYTPLVIGFSCKDNGRDAGYGVSPTLRAMGGSVHRPNGGGQVAVATIDARRATCGAEAVSVALRGRDGGGALEVGGAVGGCLRASSGGGDKPHVFDGMQVRRLTPRECERLQGLPDDWTRIAWRGKAADMCHDGPRYKGVGNGQTVTVMQWLAERVRSALVR